MKRIIAMSAILLASATALFADDPAVEPKKEPVDVAKTAERIVQNANEAGKRLGAKDPGEDTRKIQNEILKDIDALIRKAQEPPPEQNMGGSGGMSNMGGGMSNSGGGMSNSGGGMSNSGGGMSKEPMGGKNSSANGPLSREERRERARQNAGKSAVGSAEQSLAKSDPNRTESKSGIDPFGGAANRIEPKAAMPRVPDVYKEVWGHLPEKMRQEMDLYFRERFMPRYSDLLRQYYSSLAERNGKNGP